MDELKESLSTQEVPEDGGSAVGSREEGNSQTEESSEGAKDDGAAARQEQTRKTNAMMAAARRQAEKETREQMQQEQDERIAAMRIPNPAKPGEYFTSVADMDAYSKALKRSNAEKRAEREKRDVSEILEEDENREYIARKRREEAAKAQKQENDTQKDFIARDIENFRERHPDVDIGKLDENKAFRRFAGSRYGKEPLADLYDDYMELISGAKGAEAARQKDREDRSTGSGNGGKAISLTAEQQRDLDRWNENNPEMRMTAKEFLER